MEDLVYTALKVLILIALTEITKRVALVEKHVPTAAQPVLLGLAAGEPTTGALAAATVATINGLASRFGNQIHIPDPTPKEMDFLASWAGRPALSYAYTVHGHKKAPPGYRAYHVGRNGQPITIMFVE